MTWPPAMMIRNKKNIIFTSTLYFLKTMNVIKIKSNKYVDLHFSNLIFPYIYFSPTKTIDISIIKKLKTLPSIWHLFDPLIWRLFYSLIRWMKRTPNEIFRLICAIQQNIMWTAIFIFLKLECKISIILFVNNIGL